MKKVGFVFLFLIIGFLWSCRPFQTAENESADFELLKYNNPGLVVDLGVGLWGWPLPMDYDNDGDMDLVVSCPDTPFNGTYFFENTLGKGEKMPVFAPPIKIEKGDKNIQVSYVNGAPIVTGRGVEYKDFLKKGLSEPVELFPIKQIESEFKKIRFSQWKYVDYDGDGDQDLIAGISDWGDYGWDNAFDEQGNWTNGPLHGYVFFIENVDGEYVSKGKIEAGGKPIDVYGAPSPNLMDFDNDGDLDIICGEFIDKLTWFENIGSREEPVYAEGRFLENEDGIIKMDLQMIVPTAVDWDGDGDFDLIVGDEDGRVAFIENTGEVKNSMPVFASPRYFQQQADLVKFGALATPFAVDWDNDGDLDLITGNSAGYIGFIENLDGGNPPKWNKPVYLKAGGEPIRILAGENGSIQGPAEAKWGYTTLSVADWDGDGLQDIIANSIFGKIVWYKNVGTKTEPVLENARFVTAELGENPPKPAWNWWNPEPNQLVTQWRTTPYAIDWNNDGLTDLIMLDTEGYLSFYERYMENGIRKLMPGKRIFYGENGSVFDGGNNVKDESSGLLRLNNREAGGSGRRKLCFTDWDGDGDFDLIVNSRNASLFENVKTENGKVHFNHRGTLSDKKIAGHTTSPTIVDWGNSKLPELLIGAEDGNFYYLSQD
ncbi:Repeat domain-containing protein [Mariniphaga anaerophila]|uniref:Repeat domain-containing protein n=1 Tax=Mariniphaga anaerophila TaxID=1484053 RepID=A0A1M5AQQ4_9BACT|nr:VCBS repeat-containing protein [Mariniphaga anaerophila]SHF32262.1 Repeat domain-containing protein [Mariniphaga anaerophila]